MEEENQIEEKKDDKPTSFWSRLKDSIVNVPMKFSLAMLIVGFSAYLSVSFFSFFFTGWEDQSLLRGDYDDLYLSENVQNWTGLWGACLSDFLINRMFGIPVFAYIFYLYLIGFWLIGVRPFKGKMDKVFFVCSFILIWGSLFLGSFISDYDSTFLFLGGEHGYQLNLMLRAYIGWVGVALVLFVLLLLFSFYAFPSFVNWIVNLVKKPDSEAVENDETEDDEDDEDDEDVDDEEDDEDDSEEDTSNEEGENGPTEEIDGDSEDGDSQEIHSGEENQPEFIIEKAEPADSDSANPSSPVGNQNDTLTNNNESSHSSDSEDSEGGVSFVIEKPQPTEMVDPTPSSDGNAKELPKDEQSAEKSFSPEPFASKTEKNEVSEKAETAPEFTIEENVEVEQASEIDELGPYDPTKDLEFYKKPTLDLLNTYTTNHIVDEAEQNKNMNRIKEVLQDFKVEIKSIKATVGPTVTLYEVTPMSGVRIAKIKGLGDDIALSIAARGIRIIAPIPGKGTIGIEVPNAKPVTVSMAELLGSKKYQETNYELPMVLGKTITNDVFMLDLCKMPHVLVAGATGQGKSVGLNVIITSLLYKKHPSELKFVLVDPKMVEFSMYSPIEKNFLAKMPDEEDAVITVVEKVVRTMNSLCVEMEKRYELLKLAGVRELKSYNEKVKSRMLNPNNGHHFMPYIVVIIDEFADLLMTVGKDIEVPIARLAQKARAVGIHVILATQRPSANIITGVIRANFPARFAFKVSSALDSRVILDSSGAEQLVGRGDMLVSSGNGLERVQCAFIDTPEVERVAHYISEQQSYTSAFELPEFTDPEESSLGGSSRADKSERDPLFADVAQLVVSKQMGAASMIQREFKIGYNKASRIMDQLEYAGIVGPMEGSSKRRQVLVQDMAQLDAIINAQ